MIIKAVGDWELDILAVPFGGADNKDADGEWFDADTLFHEDKFGLPPLVHYHGYTETGKPEGAPVYLGKTIERWVDQAGIWYRGVLDKTIELAGQIMDGAQKDIARASSGSVTHLARVDDDGHIREWPVTELSIFNAIGNMQPANRHAVAMPVAKAIYLAAGLDWPGEGGDPETDPEAAAKAGAGSVDHTGDSDVTIAFTGDTKMEDKDIQALATKTAQEAVAVALKADKEEREAAEKLAAEEAERTAVAVKAAMDARDKDDAKKGRLPVVEGVPHLLKYNAPMSNLSPADLAFGIDTMGKTATTMSAQRPTRCWLPRYWAKRARLATHLSPSMPSRAWGSRATRYSIAP